MARRNCLVREYSKLSRTRRDIVEEMLKEDAAALHFARQVMEGALGIIFLMLSVDMRSLVLLANQSTEKALGYAPKVLLGR